MVENVTALNRLLEIEESHGGQSSLTPLIFPLTPLIFPLIFSPLLLVGRMTA